MMGAPLLLAALLSQVTPPLFRHEEPLQGRVSLVLSSDRNAYHVGETARLRVTLRNVSDEMVAGFFTLSPNKGKTTVYWRKPAATFERLSHLHVAAHGIERLVKLAPDEEVSEEFVVAFEPRSQLPLLNEVGTHDAQAKYLDMSTPNALLESNVLSLSVSEAPPSERSALTAYRQGLAFFTEFHPAIHNATPAQIQAAADFLENYPGSVYWNGVLDGLWAAVGERVSAKVASESEEALLKRIREEWSDATPPALTVLASPSTLWPPNHELIPVTVTVDVTDDRDRNPKVTLVSITCGDSASSEPKQKGQGQPASQGCDPADIADAAYGTDDRDFRLRAERVGHGPGRTYTIIYEAKDAAGNKTMSTTTVTVAHDQGVAKKK